MRFTSLRLLDLPCSAGGGSQLVRSCTPRRWPQLSQEVSTPSPTGRGPRSLGKWITSVIPAPTLRTQCPTNNSAAISGLIACLQLNCKIGIEKVVVMTFCGRAQRLLCRIIASRRAGRCRAKKDANQRGPLNLYTILRSFSKVTSKQRSERLIGVFCSSSHTW